MATQATVRFSTAKPLLHADGQAIWREVTAFTRTGPKAYEMTLTCPEDDILTAAERAHNFVLDVAQEAGQEIEAVKFLSTTVTSVHA
jgi:hypothetical protein